MLTTRQVIVFGQTRFLKRSLRQLTCPAYYYDTQGRIIAFNKAFQQLHPNQTLLGTPIQALYPNNIFPAGKLPPSRCEHIAIHHPEGLQEHTLTQLTQRQRTWTLGLVNTPPTDHSNNSTFPSQLEEHLLQLPAYAYWLDKTGRLIGCSNQLLALTGLSRHQIRYNDNLITLGETAGILAHDLLTLRAHDLKAMKEKCSRNFEETVRIHNTSHVFLSCKQPIFSDGECVGLLNVSVDISEYKDQTSKLKESVEALKAVHHTKSHFIANISHDLRTPLHTILATTELLQMQPHPKEQSTHLDTMMECGHTLLRLVENVLNFSKLNTDSVSVLEETFDIRHLINSLVETAKPLADRKSLSLNVSLDKRLPTMLTGNAHAISRIIINLVQNAIKFTVKGNIDVSLTVDTLDEQQAQCILSVQDTGIGIDRNAQEDIFNRFYQMSPSWKTNQQGSGLGLAIVKKFTELLNGEVTLSSEPNVGTTFVCRFPLTVAENQQAPIKETYPTHLTDTRILLVEDSPLVQKVCVHTLENFGCQVALAETGQQAIDITTHESFDLIFLDMGLPDMDGLSVAKALSKYTDTPVVALTAHDDPELKQACQNLGLVGFITKPASYRDLLKAITTHVKQEEAVV